MKLPIYLDNSATTKPCAAALEYMRISMEENWGNPSSLHTLGMNAEISISNTRKAISQKIKCREDEIVFTGSGTEANNLALFSAASKGKRQGSRIITTAIEHPSVLEPLKKLESEGFEVIRLSPDKSGAIPLEAVEKAADENTILFSMMLVNNETGVFQPVKEAADIIRRKAPKALIHCDAVQGFGKVAISCERLGVDLLSASAHKVHGPKGIGFLYIKKSVKIPAFILGGGQERGMRSGTESVPLICSFNGALIELPDITRQLEVTRELWQYAIESLSKTGIVTINFKENCLPYILNISVLGYRSETLLHFLESKNIFVSSGSACAKGVGSYVLSECGLDRARIDSALRISFSRFNTREDVDTLCSALIEATQKLRKAQK